MSARRLLIILLVVGGLAAAVVFRARGNVGQTVVLISIDTCRPDRLGAYGGKPGTSPHLDALAEDGVVYEQVLATSPWTLPSHMTMLTGLDPVAHGVRNSDYMLSGHVTTLAEALKSAGYRTGGFTAGGFVSARYGFGQGFDVYRETTEPDGGPVGFTRVLPEALDWLGGSREDTFLFLHTFDVHAPYDSCDPDTLAEFRARPVEDGPDDYQLHRLSFLYQQNRMRVTEYARLGELLNDYDAGLHMADAGVGRVIEALRASGRLENALIIVTSDHGESFADHGIHIGHGIGLTDDELHVPLIIRYPKAQYAGGRIGNLVDLVDIAPTVLGVMKVPTAPEMEGENLIGLPAGLPRRRDYVMGLSQNAETCFIVRNGFKFISMPSIQPMDIARRHLGPFNPPTPGEQAGDEYEHGRNPVNPIMLRYDFAGDPLGLRDVLLEVPQLYDRAKDPKELDNLWKRDPKTVELLSASLRDLYLQSAALHESMDDGQVPQPLDPHQKQTLDALGYIGASDPTSQRANYDQLPNALKIPLRNPYEAPDTTLLVEADRSAQYLRSRVEQHLELPEGWKRKLQDLGNKYLLWAVQNPSGVARVRWRVDALMKLAEQAGVTLNVDQYRERFRQLDANAAKQPKDDGAGKSNSPPPPAEGETTEPPGGKAQR